MPALTPQDLNFTNATQFSKWEGITFNPKQVRSCTSKRIGTELLGKAPIISTSGIIAHPSPRRTRISSRISLQNANETYCFEAKFTVTSCLTTYKPCFLQRKIYTAISYQRQGMEDFGNKCATQYPSCSTVQIHTDVLCTLPLLELTKLSFCK